MTGDRSERDPLGTLTLETGFLYAELNGRGSWGFVGLGRNPGLTGDMRGFRPTLGITDLIFLFLLYE